jgi:hypothetical protein
MTYTFSAIYKDGNKLTLSDTLSYDNLPRENIDCFEVQRDNTPFLLMKLDEGQKPIYRKRIERIAGNESETAVYLLGWQQNGVQSINYITEDGKIVQAGKWDNNDAWMYAPQLRSFEQ